MKDRKFIRYFAGIVIAFIALAGLANYLIDPYGLHFHGRYEGFNKQKPAFNKYSRVSKLFNADAVEPDALFLGSSRMLYLAPEENFSAYKDLSYYSFALQSGRPNEMCELLAYAIRNYDISYVCYGIDYISMCSWNGKYGNGFDRDLVSGRKSKFLEFIKMHTSLQALEESFNCVKTNIADPSGTAIFYHYNRYGSRTNSWREMMYEKNGDAWLDDAIHTTLETYSGIYSDSNLYIPYYNTLAYRTILTQCHENGIEFDAFINPLYKDQFELLISSAVYPSYIEFISFLAKNGGVWYFGGINEITSDKNYYWDSQHPRKKLSEIIVPIMLSGQTQPYQDALFGTFYTNENVDVLISELDKLRKEILK